MKLTTVLSVLQFTFHCLSLFSELYKEALLLSLDFTEFVLQLLLKVLFFYPELFELCSQIFVTCSSG